MFKQRKTAPDPYEDGLREIQAWRADFIACHEEFLLHEFPDRHLVELVEKLRQQRQAIGNARVAELTELLRARHNR
jgi:site-specific DNA-cytosine methylase